MRINHLPPQQLPPPLDEAAAETFWQEIQAPYQSALIPHQQVLTAIAAASPYMRQLLLQEVSFLVDMLEKPPEASLARINEEFLTAAQQEDQAGFMAKLRQGKARSALVIALYDCAGAWSQQEVTHHLTAMADHMVQAAVNWLLHEAQRTGKLHGLDSQNPAIACGYVVLAMGKHGAAELNYSSDIDLIILYDSTTQVLSPDVEPATFFVRLTKKLVALLQDVTSDGYGLRVDLRLRPDPRATQVAISLEAAANYYESMGQNWERAAMIKARPVAGDVKLGQEFLDRLKPYIWRKYLDFAAISDVQSLIKQIHAVKGHGTIATYGHNLKLGRGGIREIEFFVQTQQLIAGGRNPQLRGKRTTDMLAALANAGWISPQAAEELKTAYDFLRTIEHRIQMVNDEQSHTLPNNSQAFANLARFSGFRTPQEFEEKLRKTLAIVQRHSSALFEDAKDLASGTGSLVFTGGEDDPETLQTLREMGFTHTSELSATIRGWHFGRYAATRSAKSRELLTELMPQLLQALAQTGDSDAAFLAFDQFIAGLPAGVQLFSMLKANPELLTLIAKILGTAPRLAQQLRSRPRVLDAVLEPGFFTALPQREDIATALNSMAPEGLALDELADRIRIIAREQMFRVGVRVLSETVSGTDVGAAYSLIAEMMVQRLHQAVQADMEKRHGKVPGGASVIVALGKMGGREMTAGSDLDLMLIYDHDEGADMSDGEKPLTVNQYYARLTQRLVTAITAPTAEGSLYEVDLRLRPSGSKGPVATSLASFISYHQHSAWTWETLALTRARLVSGDGRLSAKMQQAMTNILTAPRNMEKTRQDVAEMRNLMRQELGDKGLWDIKRVRGGLVDVEFLAQYLQLAHAPQHPDLLSQNTKQAIQNLSDKKLLPPIQADQLLTAIKLYQDLTQLLRLSVSGEYQPETGPLALNAIILRVLEAPDMSTAIATLELAQTRVTAIFDEIIGDGTKP